MNGVRYEPVDLSQHLEMLCDWHEDHAAINFPDSTYKRDLFRTMLLEQAKLPKTTMLLIDVNGKIAGWFWTVVKFDVYKDTEYGELRYIHLLPEFRGNGVGSEVLKQIDQIVRDKHGASEIRLGTSWDNRQSITAYDRAGYVIKRVIMEKKYRP